MNTIELLYAMEAFGNVQHLIFKFYCVYLSDWMNQLVTESLP